MDIHGEWSTRIHVISFIFIVHPTLCFFSMVINRSRSLPLPDSALPPLHLSFSIAATIYRGVHPLPLLICKINGSITLHLNSQLTRTCTGIRNRTKSFYIKNVKIVCRIYGIGSIYNYNSSK